MAPGTDLSFLANEIEGSDNVTLPKKNVKIHLNPENKGSTVLHPSLVTKEFDELRFEAAAFRQLDISNPEEVPIEANVNLKTLTLPQLSSLLISSPYNEPHHYLDLVTLDLQNLIFAKALTAFQAVRPDYAIGSYTESFNFPAILNLTREFSAAEGLNWKEYTFYVVIFRSKLQAGIDNDLLYKLDFESHREACDSGGLLKYWFGKPDAERQNLATCFWRSREDAHKGGLGPWHAKARAAGRVMYEQFKFSTHRFTILDGAEDFRFEAWGN